MQDVKFLSERQEVLKGEDKIRSATGGKEEDGWRLEPEGETETQETIQ